jgi:hypothetical protein
MVHTLATPMLQTNRGLHGNIVEIKSVSFPKQAWGTIAIESLTTRKKPPK